MPIIQCTISGIDGGGYMWENVFHLSYDNATDPIHEILQRANAQIVTNVLTPYSDCMTQDAKILEVSSRKIDDPTSITIHTPAETPGSRALPAAVGALAAVVNWIPQSGNKAGRMFVVGAAIADFVLDVIDPAYLALIVDLSDAMMLFDGSDPTDQFQLVIVNKLTMAAIPAVDYQLRNHATTLNKRMRA